MLFFTFIKGGGSKLKWLLYWKASLLKYDADQKIERPNFHFWNAHISLIKAPIFTSVSPCNRAVNSFSKLYDTWKSAKNEGERAKSLTWW